MFADMNGLERFLGALFSSVTPRTAGFNTVDTASLSNTGKLMTMMLMLLVEAPVQQRAVSRQRQLWFGFYAIAMIGNREDINMFGRRLTDEVVKKANAVIMINFTLAMLAAMFIMGMQPMLALTDVVFEVLSAIGTAGMTTGITRDLNTISRLIVIVLMYCGRLGSLSFALIFAQKSAVNSVRQPQEKIIVG